MLLLYKVFGRARGNILRALRYECALVCEDLGQHKHARSELENSMRKPRVMKIWPQDYDFENRSMKMIDSFEYKGIWWLPENEDIKLDGTLKFTLEDDTPLELSGSFQEITDLTKVLNWDIIPECTVTEKEVPLLHNISLGTPLHFPGIPTSSVKNRPIEGDTMPCTLKRARISILD